MQCPSVEFHLIQNSQDLISFVPQWRNLWLQDPNAKPFQSPEWLVPWWKQFGNERLCAHVILRGGRPVGFLPFYVYHDPERHQRQLLPFGVGTTDYLDGVFLPECGASEIRKAIAVMRAEVKHDVFCIPQLQSQSRLLEALQERSPETREERAAFISQSEPCSRMPAVTLPELPQKIKRNAMYYRNRAQRKGILELVQADENNWQESFEALCRLHSSRWQSRGEKGVLADERVVAWHREAIPLLLKAGLLRLMTLRVNEEVIAVLYSVVDRERAGRTQYFYITAYSPEHADLRPGTLLIAYTVEHAVCEGVATIDMLRGNEGYKEIWHMEKAPTWCVTQFSAQGIAQESREQSAA